MQDSEFFTTSPNGSPRNAPKSPARSSAGATLTTGSSAAVRPALRAEQVAIGGIIGVGKEGLLPAVAALGHVVRDAGNDVASEAGHQAIVAYRAEAVNLVHCHRNLSHFAASPVRNHADRHDRHYIE
jgi:hypothetical protein